MKVVKITGDNTTTKPLNQNKMLGNILIAIRTFFNQH